MKTSLKNILLTGITLWFCMGVTAQDSRINQLIQKKELLKAREVLGRATTLSPEAKAIYTAVLQNAFGKADSSSQTLGAIRNPKAIKDDTLRHFYYSASYDNAVKLFQYNQAITLGNYLFDKFPSFYTEEELEEEKQGVLIWKTLGDIPAQTLNSPDTVYISLKKDIAGLWNVPVAARDSSYDLVFDSGAGLSVITESYADRLGVRSLPGATIPIKSGITGLETPARIGIAPLLKIKNITIQNAVFLIFPDESLSFANGAYRIRGIIGFPVIREMGVLHFTGNDLMVTKSNKEANAVTNMMIDQLKPVVYLQYENDLLPFTFDSGAKLTIFSDVFYNKYKTSLQKTGFPTLQTVGGASGQASLQVLEMPELKLKCVDKEIVLKKIAVSKEPINTNGTLYYGNVGQDVIGQFKTMVISFKDCFLRFEN